jgi:hypothetical protein
MVVAQDPNEYILHARAEMNRLGETLRRHGPTSAGKAAMRIKR